MRACIVKGKIRLPQVCRRTVGVMILGCVVFVGLCAGGVQAEEDFDRLGTTSGLQQGGICQAVTVNDGSGCATNLGVENCQYCPKEEESKGKVTVKIVDYLVDSAEGTHTVKLAIAGLATVGMDSSKSRGRTHIVQIKVKQ